MEAGISGGPSETVVVGVDGSEHSYAACLEALREVRARHARLRLVLAWHIPAGAYGSVGFTAPDDPYRTFEGGAKETLAGMVRRLREEHPEVELEPVLRKGRPASVLIEESKAADLLVVGSRGHGGFVGLLLGSVSQECAEHAHCPVLIVHQRTLG